MVGSSFWFVHLLFHCGCPYFGSNTAVFAPNGVPKYSFRRSPWIFLKAEEMEEMKEMKEMKEMDEIY